MSQLIKLKHVNASSSSDVCLFLYSNAPKPDQPRANSVLNFGIVSERIKYEVCTVESIFNKCWADTSNLLRMSAVSAFRVAAVGVFNYNARFSGSQILSSALRSTSRHTCPHGCSFHVSSTSWAWVKNTQSNKPKEAQQARKTKERKQKEIGLRDRDIPYREVQVSSPEGLSDFRPLFNVISEVEHRNALDSGGRKRYHAQLIANVPSPIVKIIDSKEEFKKKKEAHERAKSNAAQKVTKEVQLTWNSSEIDIQTKLGKVKDDLQRGYKVDLVIMPKQGTRSPRFEVMKERAEEIVGQLSGIGIAKERKARYITRATSVIYLQGTAIPSAALEEEAADGVPKKVLLREQRKQKEDERSRKKREQDELDEKYLSELNSVLPS